MQAGPIPSQMLKTDPCSLRGSTLSIRGTEEQGARGLGRRLICYSCWEVLPAPLGTWCHSLAMQGSHRQGAPWKDNVLLLEGRCPTFVPGKGMVWHKNAHPEEPGAPP